MVVAYHLEKLMDTTEMVFFFVRISSTCLPFHFQMYLVLLMEHIQVLFLSLVEVVYLSLF